MISAPIQEHITRTLARSAGALCCRLPTRSGGAARVCCTRASALSSSSSSSSVHRSSLKPKPKAPQQQQPSVINSSSSSTQHAAAAMATSAAATTKKAQQQPGSASAEDVLKLFAGAMPKEEIGALRFLHKHPEYDGRGVVVAIFDTGVDPSAAGLQVTTDGKQKIIDVIDCTGSGDVDTSATATADEAGCITGASGRRLRLNPGWTNPSGKWHVGCRRLFELFPRSLQGRVKQHRKKAFDEAQRKALADTAAALAAAAKAPAPAASPAAPAAAGDAAAGSEAAAAADAAPAAPVAAAAGPGKPELEARLAYLQEAAKNNDDPGPVVDCVAWHDGDTWRVALDTADLYQNYSVTNASSTSSSSDALAPAAEAASDAAGSAGLLADFVPLADFAVERQHGVFSEVDGCAFAVKIYDEGNTVSVVVDAGAHGTHVAGIVAAHFPEDPAANGIAPGAQIISCKIGDSRLGSMETGTGLVRALIAVMNAGCDIINMSYGEPAARSDVGRAIEVAAEAVNKSGVIFVASAGNAGPALSTVGAPGGTTSALIGVGAYVSPDLAAAGHSLRDDLAAGQQYTWSSRGPTADGDPGVCLSAPGGAVAPVPSWTLQKRQLMNGTSMSSPCAAGGLALLLSGLKALGAAGPTPAAAGPTPAAASSSSSSEEQQWISPARVRRAVEATCKPLGGAAPDAVLTYGRGLLQVDAAFDYLLRSAEADKPDTRYVVSVSGGPGCVAGLGVTRRGVYMRQPHEAAGPASYSVTVTPTLHEDASVAEKLAVEEHLTLTCTAPWLSAPGLLLLHHNGRSFELRVDPTQLPPGLHYAEVLGVCPAAEWRGPLFRVPVTVVKPQSLLQVPDIDAVTTTATASLQEASAQPGSSASSSGGAWAASSAAAGEPGGAESGLLPPHTLRLGPLALAPGQELRHFVAVPAGATWAELLVRGGQYDTPKMLLIRATQLLPDVRYTDTEYRTNLTLSPNSEFTSAFKVVGDATLELTLSQFWSSLGSSSVEVELSFFGLACCPVAAVTSAGGNGNGGATPASGAGMVLDGAAGFAKLLVSSPLRRQRIKPEAKLTHINQAVRPKDSQLEPLLDPRDALPGGRLAYRLVLSYGFSISEGGKHKPLVPLTNRNLYDSPLESQLTQVFDANKRLLYTGDAVPEELSLTKGDYTARLMLRHDNITLLDKLKGTCLVLSRKLDSPVSVPVYSSQAAATTGGSPAGESFLGGGDSCVLWLGPMPEDNKLPKDAAGRVMEGSLSLGQLRRGSGAAPGAVPFTFITAPAAAAKKDADSKAAAKPAKPPAERLSEAVRDAKIALLKELKPDVEEEQTLAASLAAELLADSPDHLPLLLELLKREDAAAKGDARAAKLPAIIAAADRVTAAIDTTQLAAFLALRPPPDNGDANGNSSSSSSSASTSSASTSSASSSAKSYKEEKAEKDAAKAALTTALKAKLQAQLELWEAASGDAATAAAADIAATAAQLRQWLDTAAEKDCMLLHARVEAAAGRLAAALSACDKLIAPSDEAPGSTAPQASKLKQRLLQRLGWSHWAAYEQSWARVRFPDKLPPL